MTVWSHLSEARTLIDGGGRPNKGKVADELLWRCMSHLKILVHLFEVIVSHCAPEAFERSSRLLNRDRSFSKDPSAFAGTDFTIWRGEGLWPDDPRREPFTHQKILDLLDLTLYTIFIIFP